MDHLPLDPNLAVARLRAEDRHRQAAHARLVAAARPHRTNRTRRAIAVNRTRAAAAAWLRLQLPDRAAAGPAGVTLQPCC